MYKSSTSKEDVVDLPKTSIEPSSELKDINTINTMGLNYTDLTTSKLKEHTLEDRLRKSRLELGLSICEVVGLYHVTKSVISGYDLNGYTPTKEVLKLLYYTFNMDYLCMDVYTKIVYNFDKFNEGTITTYK